MRTCWLALAGALCIHGHPMWTPVTSANKADTLTLRFALHPSDPNALDNAFHSISDLTSSSYGQFLTSKQLKQLVRPCENALMEMNEFLHGWNWTESIHGDYIRLEILVQDANELFHTKFIEYEHVIHPHRRIIRPISEGYHLPDSVKAHVAFVDGLDHFPSNVHTERHLIETSKAEIVSISDILHAYDVPENLDASDERNGIVIGAFLHETFIPKDIETYMQRLTYELHVSHIHIENGVHSKNLPKAINCAQSEATGEASLDTELIAALTRSKHAAVLCYDDNRDPTQSFNDGNQEPFLAFMQDVNAMEPPPAIVSISYADDECAMPIEYITAIDNEFKKAGARGTTVVVSSGDNGVVGSRFVSYCGSAMCSNFQSQYPASSPFVLCVGATRFEKELSNELGLSVRNGGAITTGAGFSGYINRTDYVDFQSNHIPQLLDKLSTPFKSRFNAFGRAFPDVVAIGHGIGTIVNGRMQVTDGTSVSAPVVASILAHVNKWRLTHGRPTLGYVVPYLYKMHSVCPFIFRDVVSGENACGGQRQQCCTVGFEAGSGYDILTGLGAIQYKSFVENMDHCESLLQGDGRSVLESTDGPLIEKYFPLLVAVVGFAIVGFASQKFRHESDDHYMSLS